MKSAVIVRTTAPAVILALWAAIACSTNGGNGSNGTAGPTGPQGPPGTSVTPTLVGVTPRAILLDREVDVVVAGDATSFTGSELPDFGPGVAVSAVAAQSPTALSAHLKVDKSAAVGPRDFHVGPLTATKAVVVSPAIDVSV